MPPRNLESSGGGIIASGDSEVEPVITEETHEQKRPPLKIVWRNVFWLGYLHLGALYGLYLIPWAHPLTWIWFLVMYQISALGITAGAHRLWSHRSYKAKLPLRILLAIFQTTAFQNDIIEWARDHRVHHKFSETDADPHNAKRGFFFAHCGWLMVRKHPDVRTKGKQIDLSDLYADPVLAIQRKLYLPAMILLCFLVPAFVPWYLWGESWWTGFCICSLLRYSCTLHATWCVNSIAHMWGNRPYDRSISPAESLFVTWSAIGEGFHNYHHTFPHDYSTSEFGWRLNLTTLFIDLMARIGLVSLRKRISREMIEKRKTRTGDGTDGGFGLLDSETHQD